MGRVGRRRKFFLGELQVEEPAVVSNELNAYLAKHSFEVGRREPQFAGTGHASVWRREAIKIVRCAATVVLRPLHCRPLQFGRDNRRWRSAAPTCVSRRTTIGFEGLGELVRIDPENLASRPPRGKRGTMKHRRRPPKRGQAGNVFPVDDNPIGPRGPLEPHLRFEGVVAAVGALGAKGETGAAAADFTVLGLRVSRLPRRFSLAIILLLFAAVFDAIRIKRGSSRAIPSTALRRI